MRILRTSCLESFDRVATSASCCLGETIYHQGARADNWYGVIAGAVRQTRLTPDGRRHIVTFLLPGDLFGFGSSGSYQFSAEAIAADTTVARYPRLKLESLAETE